MKMINLIKAELVMLLGELKQYYMNYVFYNLGMLLLFVGLFYDHRGSGGSAIVLLFGLVTWQMCISSLSYLCYVVEDESLLGTLEQIFMTRTSVISVFVSKVIVNLLFSVSKGLVLFLICMFIFGIQGSILSLGLKIFPILLVILVTILSFYFLGLMFGGIALFQKRISSITQPLTYLMLFFTNITVPVEELPKLIQPVSYVIPITWATKVIDMLVNGVVNNGEFIRCCIGLGVSATVFGILGYVIFRKAILKAKMLGKLGQY